MRLFVGLPIPNEIAPRLTALAQRISAPNLRYTSAENLHITLYFLGQVEEGRLKELRSSLDQVGSRELHLTVRALGAFPRAGVVYAEVEENPSLTSLQLRVAERFARFAHVADPNSPPHGEYRPHITLARSRQPLRMRAMDLPRPDQPIRFTVGQVHLYESRTGPTGSRYTVLHTANTRAVT